MSEPLGVKETHAGGRTKRVWTKSTGDAVGTVRVTFALYDASGTRVRGNRQRSLIVEGARVSEAHKLALSALAGIAREAHNAPKADPLVTEENT